MVVELALNDSRLNPGLSLPLSGRTERSGPVCLPWCPKAECFPLSPPPTVRIIPVSQLSGSASGGEGTPEDTADPPRPPGDWGSRVSEARAQGSAEARGALSQGPA